MNIQYAPIFIPTLNRYQHLKQCIESLSKCTYAEKTEVFIYLDYPVKEEHWDGYKKIKEYIPTIKGFKAITTIKRTENYGAEKNFIEGHKELLNNYDRIIITEDDNEFSPNFLEYINKGLSKFENNQNVRAICGYLYPLKEDINSESNFFYGKAYSAWGVGIWRHKPLHMHRYTIKELKRFVLDKKIRKKIKYFYESKLFSIKGDIERGYGTFGDSNIVIEIILNNQYCIFPTLSKVRNNGHDGSGAHCGKDINNIYTKQVIDTDNYFSYSHTNPIEDQYLNDILRRYFSRSLKYKIKKLIADYLRVLHIKK